MVPVPEVAGENENGLHALLGQRVRDARARRFMTRKALAQESGISIAYLARVENGTGNISLGLLQRLALALNLPIESFFIAEESSNADFTMIVEFLRRQSPEKLATIRRQLFDGDESSQRIALIGIRGVGKSTLGPLLAEHLGLPLADVEAFLSADGSLVRLVDARRAESRCLCELPQETVEPILSQELVDPDGPVDTADLIEGLATSAVGSPARRLLPVVLAIAATAVLVAFAMRRLRARSRRRSR